MARQRLEDLRKTMAAAQDLLAGTPLEAALGPVLARMARIAAATRPSGFRRPASRPVRPRSSRSDSDPVLASPAARATSRAAARGEACLRLRRGEPRPGPRARARRAPFWRCSPCPSALRRAARGWGIFSHTAGHRQARPGGDRSPRRDSACPVRRPRAGGHARHREGRRARPGARPRRQRLAPRPRAPRGLDRDAARPPGENPATAPDAPRGPRSSTSGSRPPWPPPWTTPGRSSRSAGARSAARPSTWKTCSRSCARPRSTVQPDRGRRGPGGRRAAAGGALRAIADEVRSRSGANTAPLSIRAGVWSDGVRVSVSSPRGAATAAVRGRSPPAWV